MTCLRYAAVLALASLQSAHALVCTTHAIDFNTLSRGDYLTTQFEAEMGLTVDCDSQEGFGCRIFDTAVPWGEWESGSGCACSIENCSETKKKNCGDSDLGSPHMDCPGGGLGEGTDGGPDAEYPNCEPRGNVLIIDENGPGKPPDDSVNGGKMRFNFAYPVDLDQVCLLDVDAQEQTWVSVYYNDGTSEKNIPIPRLGDGGYGCFDLSPYAGVVKLIIKMDGSGSISDLKYTLCDPTKGGGGGGDPHVQRWNRERSTFHGECDLVMVHSDEFHNEAGLDLHVRATMFEDLYSYFEAAAMRIGDHTMELHKHEIILDGVSHAPADLPLTFGDDDYKYTLDIAELEAGKNPANRQQYKLDLHEDSSIRFNWYREMLTISVKGHENDFGDASGLLGDYHNGDMIGREGQLMNDFNDFGFEWQVNPAASDKMLFREAREPQLPYEKCRMPSKSMQQQQRRLLRGDKVLLAAANEACASKNDNNDFTLCVNDVMITGDLEMAQAW